METKAPVGCCNFSTKIMHFYAYFGQNSYHRATTHQLKAFEKQSNRTKLRKWNTCFAAFV